MTSLFARTSADLFDCYHNSRRAVARGVRHTCINATFIDHITGSVLQCLNIFFNCLVYSVILFTFNAVLKHVIQTTIKTMKTPILFIAAAMLFFCLAICTSPNKKTTSSNPQLSFVHINAVHHFVAFYTLLN